MRLWPNGRIPPHCGDSPATAQAKILGGRVNTHSTEMAPEAMVPRPSQAVGRDTMVFSNQGQPSQAGALVAPETTILPLNCVEVEMAAISRQGYSTSVVGTLVPIGISPIP